MDSELRVDIEKLHRSHDRSDFDCGEPDLNEFLQTYAAQNARKKLSTTYVAVAPGSPAVLGYYSISSGQVACEDLSDEQRAGLPRYPIPVVKLARLATDQRVQGRGLGRWLVVDALRRALALSEVLGIHAVKVDALTPGARDFYRNLGFHSLQDDELHLYISLKTVAGLFEAE
jgi:GNAT superfamily N-acetyltransferase